MPETMGLEMKWEPKLVRHTFFPFGSQMIQSVFKQKEKKSRESA